jgi:hypothetical protein
MEPFTRAVLLPSCKLASTASCLPRPWPATTAFSSKGRGALKSRSNNEATVAAFEPAAVSSRSRSRSSETARAIPEPWMFSPVVSS